MSMISEQVKELKWCASYQDCEKVKKMMYQAADTIESLSAKLQAENMERSADCEKSVLEIETPKFCIDCPCHFAGESGMVMCGVEKRELLSDDIESYKPDWCPLKESADYGGWIFVEKRLPEQEECNVLCDIFDEEENRHIIKIMKYVDLGNCEYEFLNSFRVPQNVIAWQPLPEPYHEP